MSDMQRSETVLIRNTRIVDGLSSYPEHADVLIHDGTIVLIDGSIPLRDYRIIDAQGGYLLPGIIDVASPVVQFDPALTIDTQASFASMGVTTLIAGSYGFSPFPYHHEMISDFSSVVATPANYNWRTHQQWSQQLQTIGALINISSCVGVRNSSLFASQSVDTRGAIAVSASLDSVRGLSSVVSLAGEHAKPFVCALSPLCDDVSGRRLVSELSKFVSRGIVPSCVLIHARQEWFHNHPYSGIYPVFTPENTRFITVADFVPQWLRVLLASSGGAEALRDPWNQTRIKKNFPVFDGRFWTVADAAGRPFWTGLTIRELAARLDSPSDSDALLHLIVATSARAMISAVETTPFRFSDTDSQQYIVSLASVSRGMPYSFLSNPFSLYSARQTLSRILAGASTSYRNRIVRAFSSDCARIFGIAGRGVIAPGYRADLQLCDSNFVPVSTFVNGVAVSGSYRDASTRPGAIIVS
ncbi:MAG: hypothetical protein RIQ54_108 [Candidatus Parcubacteria bacterium]|jgi:N-acyl-D-aspartate/D-glutamate deacylase